MVSVLTSAGNGELYACRVPRSDTSDLAETTMGLTGKALDPPTGGDTFVTLTLGDTNDVNHLVLSEDTADGNLLLEEGLGELNLVLGSSTVHLRKQLSGHKRITNVGDNQKHASKYGTQSETSPWHVRWPFPRQIMVVIRGKNRHHSERIQALKYHL